MLNVFHQIGALGTCNCGYWHPSQVIRGRPCFFVNLAFVGENAEQLVELRQFKPHGEPFVATESFTIIIDPLLAEEVIVEGKPTLIAIVAW